MTGTEFRSAFHEHKDAIYRFAWRMTNSPGAAEDIVQEAFLALLRHPGVSTTSREKQLRSFLLGVARNLALKRWREENRWDASDDDRIRRRAGGPGSRRNRQDRRRSGPFAAAAATPKYWCWRNMKDCSLEEIARTVEAEVGTVKARSASGRENLQSHVGPPQADERKEPDIPSNS